MANGQRIAYPVSASVVSPSELSEEALRAFPPGTVLGIRTEEEGQDLLAIKTKDGWALFLLPFDVEGSIDATVGKGGNTYSLNKGQLKVSVSLEESRVEMNGISYTIRDGRIEGPKEESIKVYPYPLSDSQLLEALQRAER